MATYTPNLNLKKPSTGEKYDVIGDLNDTKDKIDLAIGNHTSQLAEKANDADVVKTVNGITPDETGNLDILSTSENLETYIESENSIKIPFVVNTTYFENIYAEQPLEMTISPNGIVRIRGKVRVKAKGSNPPIGSILEPRFALDSLPYQTSKFNILREAVSNANENHIIRFGPNNYWNPETPAIYRNAILSLRKGANTYDLEFHVLDYSKLLVNAEVYIESSAYWRYFDKGFNYKQIVSKVRNLDGNKFNFIFAPDIHASVRDSRHGEGIKLMNKCQSISPMPIVTPGDIVNNYDKSEVVNGINQIIKKIGSNFLIAKGNHDDNSLKSKSVNDVITEQELKKLFFDNMKPSGFDVTISPDGMYYYADDAIKKIRIVVLNTHENDYAIVGGNIKEDTAGKGFINQKQLEFVAKEALNLKVQKGDDYTNWHTIFMGHYPLNFAGTKAYGGETCENGTEMWKIIKAFKNGTSVTIAPTSRSNTVHSLTGLTNNFASQGSMNVVGFFYGHYHNDQMQVKDGITLVASECFSSVNYNTDWLQVERAVFSYDEFAFDIVSIDKATKSVTLKRIGNDRLGDRSFNY